MRLTRMRASLVALNALAPKAKLTHFGSQDLRLKGVYSDSQCGIRKVDVNYIDFPCPSPDRQPYPIFARESGTQRPGYGPTRALRATVPSSSGPARKHTAKFEPAAWSWARMTSGLGGRSPKTLFE
eukprot:scaffold3024_cov54-Phaeocystis_antarctica.AAC.5